MVRPQVDFFYWSPAVDAIEEMIGVNVHLLRNITPIRRSAAIIFGTHFGPTGQPFTQPGPFGPGIDPTKVSMRPEGPLVPFDEIKDRMLGPSGLRYCHYAVSQGRRALAG